MINLYIRDSEISTNNLFIVESNRVFLVEVASLILKLSKIFPYQRHDIHLQHRGTHLLFFFFMTCSATTFNTASITTTTFISSHFLFSTGPWRSTIEASNIATFISNPCSLLCNAATLLQDYQHLDNRSLANFSWLFLHFLVQFVHCLLNSLAL